MSNTDRLHALDAVRACALLLGVMFHGGFSFIPGMIPGLWAIVDNSPSTTISVMAFTTHIFRMTLFFFVAGFFARMMYHRHRKGARGFWRDRAKRILLPLVTGWIVFFPLIAVVWIWGLTKTFGGKIPPPPANMPAPPPGAFPLTHLWFLYFLLILYIIVLVVRAVIVALDRNGAIRRTTDTLTRGIVRTGTAAVLLPLPVIAAMYLHHEWYSWFGIPTPDRSVIPQLTSLIGYGTAVAFGWLIHRQLEHEDVLAMWRRQWPMHLGIAVVATIVCLTIAGVVPTFVPAKRDARTLAYAFAYGIAIWCWCFAAIGAAVRYLSAERPAVRYVADASYWIYLAHLPVVAAFQVLVGHWPLHWTVKFPLVMAASLAVLFVSYNYLVRATFIGSILNGRRYPRLRWNLTHTSWPEGQTPVLASSPESDKHH